MYDSGRQWEEIREIYLEQISNLEALQLQVQDGLECLKSESEHLQHVDGTIRRQREKLRLTFNELERKQSAFNERGGSIIVRAFEYMILTQTIHQSRKPLNKLTMSCLDMVYVRLLFPLQMNK